MGFREIRATNLALLGKQGWRLLKNPNLLVARVFRAKYHPTSEFLNAPRGNRSSFLWKSLCEGREILNLGWRFRIGEGAISICDTRWVPRPWSYCVTPTKRNLLPQGQVSELIDSTMGIWRDDRLQQLFPPYEVDIIKTIPISSGHEPDCIIWHHTKNGEYSVRSAYHAYQEHHRTMSDSGTTSNAEGGKKLWSKLWRMKVLPKVRVFLWKLASDALPLASSLSRRIPSITPQCSLCGHEYEDENHCFAGCPWTQQVWLQSTHVVDWQHIGIHSTIGRLQWILEELAGEDQSLLGHLLWTMWKARCSAVFESKIPNAREVYMQASILTTEFNRAQHHANRITSPEAEFPHKWNPPDDDVISINVDASFDHSGITACGLIARNPNNLVMQAISKRLAPGIDVLHGELLAIKEGLRLAVQMDLRRIRLQSDCLQAITLLQSPGDSLHSLFNLAQECRSIAMQFDFCSIQFIRRMGNSPAHLLARLGLDYSIPRLWGSSPPLHVLTAILADNG